MRRRRFAMWPLVVLLAATFAAAGLAFVSGGDGGDGNGDGPEDPPRLERVRSTPVDDGAPFSFGTAPDSYRITYLVRQPGKGVDTEVVTVRRPFESRVEVHEGESADGPVASLQESSFGHLAVAGASQDPLVTVVGPVLASPDLRIEPAVQEAVSTGLLEARELRRVVGRLCRVYRAGTSVTAGRLVPPSGDEHADACFGEDGLLLEEWWVAAGRPVRQRVAVDVEVGIHVDDADFTLPREPSFPADEGGGRMQQVTDDSAPPGDFYVADDVPDRFEHRGRFTVVATQLGEFMDPGRRGEIVASTADVWVDGPDFVVLDRGGALGGGRVFEPEPDARRVDLGEPGRAELLVRLDRVELRLLDNDNGFVRVYGTLPPDELIEVARSLRVVQGTGLTPLPDR